jgi:hypothetical protein
LNGVNKNIRNVKGYHLTFDTPTDIFYWNYIKKEIERLYTFYKAKFPKMSSDKINQIDLLKYKKVENTKHIQITILHTARHLSVIINLNNDYEGGDLVFTIKKKKKLKD